MGCSHKERSWRGNEVTKWGDARHSTIWNMDVRNVAPLIKTLKRVFYFLNKTVRERLIKNFDDE